MNVERMLTRSSRLGGNPLVSPSKHFGIWFEESFLEAVISGAHTGFSGDRKKQQQ